jgi:hypothetical protein
LNEEHRNTFNGSYIAKHLNLNEIFYDFVGHHCIPARHWVEFGK